MIKILSKLIQPVSIPSGSVLVPEIQVHRGFHTDGIQENTLEAFKKANYLGYKMCELDVQLSKDQVPVVIHDENLIQWGFENTFVSRLTHLELWKTANVSTLESILKDPEVTPFLNIEIKSTKFNDPITRRVVHVIQKTKSENRILFSSFNPIVIWELQNYFPKVPRALLVSQETSQKNSWYLRQMLLAPLLKLHYLNLEQKMINFESMQIWNKIEMPIAAWTVNDPVIAKSLLSLGVQSLITDHPLQICNANISKDIN